MGRAQGVVCEKVKKYDLLNAEAPTGGKRHAPKIYRYAHLGVNVKRRKMKSWITLEWMKILSRSLPWASKDSRIMFKTWWKIGTTCEQV
jgi:hypothetical protein